MATGVSNLAAKVSLDTSEYSAGANRVISDSQRMAASTKSAGDSIATVFGKSGSFGQTAALLKGGAQVAGVALLANVAANATERLRDLNGEFRSGAVDLEEYWRQMLLGVPILGDITRLGSALDSNLQIRLQAKEMLGDIQALQRGTQAVVASLVAMRSQVEMFGASDEEKANRANLDTFTRVMANIREQKEATEKALTEIAMLAQETTDQKTLDALAAKAVPLNALLRVQKAQADEATRLLDILDKQVDAHYRAKEAEEARKKIADGMAAAWERIKDAVDAVVDAVVEAKKKDDNAMGALERDAETPVERAQREFDEAVALLDRRGVRGAERARLLRPKTKRLVEAQQAEADAAAGNKTATDASPNVLDAMLRGTKEAFKAEFSQGLGTTIEKEMRASNQELDKQTVLLEKNLRELQKSNTKDRGAVKVIQTFM